MTLETKLKIAIIHDAFLYRGGGERLVTLMAIALDADIVSGFFSEGSLSPRELGFKGKMIALRKPIFGKGFRHLALKWAFFAKAQVLSKYDIVIFSGDCLGALRHVRRNAQKVYYCHTPPRYLFDFRERYLGRFSLPIRFIISKVFDFFAKEYTILLSRFDLIFTNSLNVQSRLKNFCGFDSTVLYPPTDTEKFSPTSDGETFLLKSPHFPRSKEYYFSFSRISSPKRVDMVVDAFLTLPHRNLVLTYGKNDPQKDEILKKIKNAKNIIALPSPDEGTLIELIRNAIATIYIPIDEDFGISPVESMACGIPVISVNDGGVRETIIDGKTGVLLTKNITVQDLQCGIISIDPAAAIRMKDECVLRAKEFSLARFSRELRQQLHLGK